MDYLVIEEFKCDDKVLWYLNIMCVLVSYLCELGDEIEVFREFQCFLKVLYVWYIGMEMFIWILLIYYGVNQYF